MLLGPPSHLLLADFNFLNIKLQNYLARVNLNSLGKCFMGLYGKNKASKPRKNIYYWVQYFGLNLGFSNQNHCFIHFDNIQKNHSKRPKLTL